MGYKVHRKRRYYSRRKSPYRQILAWVLAAVAVVALGFFGAKWLFGGAKNIPTATPAPAVTTTTAPTVTTTAPPVTANGFVYRGFSLPYTALTDKEVLKQTAADAAKAGFNTVVIELKDKDGNLYFVSETQEGKTVGAATADAVSLPALTDAFATLKETGIAPIPLLYAFEDIKAPHTLPAGKVSVAGHTDWMWYDGDPQKGGRPWLNPYADAAQAYIAALAKELQTAGAGAVLLDGVYFPTQTAQSDFTSAGDAALTKGEVLAGFIKRVDALCEIPVLLRCSANAALGNNTAGYDANPLTFGAAGVVADMRVSLLGAQLAVGGELMPVTAQGMSDMLSRAFDTMQKRCAETDTRPVDLWLLEGETASEQMQALRAKDADVSYVVFDKDGKYDFTALSHTTT